MQLFGDNSHLNTWTIEKAKEGDRRAQKAIYDSLSAKMFPVCLRYMGEREAAEDILQEGFVTLFSKLDTFSGDGSFEGWARKIFVNTALMSLRKNDVMKESDDVEQARSLSSESPSAVQDLGYKELLQMISELPAGFRTVFNLYVIEGMSHSDIAEVLGISEGTSRSQLLRARAMLQAKIADADKRKRKR
ncbi:MAG: sigma-70 family RNA polymerase sigma factor [Bacteroidales bacterium]|nr:sigma-70 family RNA polymerase sigma factor [Bacteroidales bacterium]